MHLTLYKLLLLMQFWLICMESSLALTSLLSELR